MRPVTQRARDLCEVLEKNGPLKPFEIYPHLPELTEAAIRTLLGRTAWQGLIKRKDGEYGVTEHWRDMLRDKPKATTKALATRHPLDSWLRATT